MNDSVKLINQIAEALKDIDLEIARHQDPITLDNLQQLRMRTENLQRRMIAHMQREAGYDLDT